MHTIAKSCSNRCFSLVDIGIESNALCYLLTQLSSKTSVAMTLTELNLTRNPLGDAGATELSRFLSKNRTLTNLQLEATQILAPGQVSLFNVLQTQNFCVTTLNLGGSCTPFKNVCGEQGALAASAAIRSNTILSTLSLAGNRMSSRHLEIFSKGLAENLQLTNLDLSDNEFGDKGVCALSSALETLALTQLRLSRTRMGDDGAKALALALSSCRPPIATLHVSGNHIAREGAAAFASVMSLKNTVLSTLKLDHNRIGGEGMKAMVEKMMFHTTVIKDKYGRPMDAVVHYPRTLTDLNLRSNDLGDVGAKAVADLIQDNSILTRLDISHNKIANPGMLLLGQKMSMNSSLRALSLSCNSFSNEGVADFVSNVQRSEHRAIHITDLDFSGNLLTEGAGSSLYTLVHASTSLTHLNMASTFLTPAENEAIEGILARNCRMLPRDPAVKMKEEVVVLEERAKIADELLATLTMEKKATFQLNSKIEILRALVGKEKEDGINEYIRMSNSTAQAKRRDAVCEQEIKQLNQNMAYATHKHGETIALRQRKVDANLEGRARQLSIRYVLVCVRICV